MFHGEMRTKIKHLEKYMDATMVKIDEQDKRLDKITVAQAKMYGIGTALLAVLQIGLKIILG